jgi:hypothetical protein
MRLATVLGEQAIATAQGLVSGPDPYFIDLFPGIENPASPRVVAAHHKTDLSGGNELWQFRAAFIRPAMTGLSSLYKSIVPTLPDQGWDERNAVVASLRVPTRSIYAALQGVKFLAPTQGTQLWGRLSLADFTDDGFGKMPVLLDHSGAKTYVPCVGEADIGKSGLAYVSPAIAPQGSGATKLRFAEMTHDEYRTLLTHVSRFTPAAPSEVALAAWVRHDPTLVVMDQSIRRAPRDLGIAM